MSIPTRGMQHTGFVPSCIKKVMKVAQERNRVGCMTDVEFAHSHTVLARINKRCRGKYLIGWIELASHVRLHPHCGHSAWVLLDKELLFIRAKLDVKMLDHFALMYFQIKSASCAEESWVCRCVIYLRCPVSRLEAPHSSPCHLS